LNGIEIYVYSSDTPLNQEDGSTDDEAMINTGNSFRWYKDPDEAWADVRSRVEGFGGNINQLTVYSSYSELKAKIEEALRSSQVALGAVLHDFKPASPPDSMFPTPFWLDDSETENS